MEAWGTVFSDGALASQGAKRPRGAEGSGGGGGGGGTGALQLELMKVVAKLTLKNTFELRAVIAVAFVCCKIPLDGEAAKAVTTTVKHHADLTRG
eukprot:13797829-Heterocapsa_arctica.AAC.1